MQTRVWRDFDVAQKQFQPDGLVFQRQAAAQVFNHLADGDRFLVNLDHGTMAGAIQN